MSDGIGTEAGPGPTALLKIDITKVEYWREYDFAGRVYWINNPQTVQ
jgi:hypothetical protein